MSLPRQEELFKKKDDNLDLLLAIIPLFTTH